MGERQFGAVSLNYTKITTNVYLNQHINVCCVTVIVALIYSLLATSENLCAGHSGSLLQSKRT